MRPNDAMEAARKSQTTAIKKGKSKAALWSLGFAILVIGSALLFWQFGKSNTLKNDAKIANLPVATTPQPQPQPQPPAVNQLPVAPVVAPPVQPQTAVPKTEKMLMDEVVASQTPGFTVSANPARPSFRIDKDRLSFSVSSERDGFVQVLWLDAEKHLTLLFPNALTDKVHIKAKQTLTLPPKQMPLVASKPEGKEFFLVIVSPQPRDFSNLSTKVVDGFQQIHLNAEFSGGASGQPPLAGVAKPCERELCQEFGAAVFSIDVVQ
jgi:hypothetical protein